MTKDDPQVVDQGFDWQKFDAYLELGSTKKLCASLMRCSEDTIERRVKEVHSCTFKEYRNEKVALTALKLQQKCIMMGLEGKIVPLLFALKNVAGWSDKLEMNHGLTEEAEKTIRLAYAIPPKPPIEVKNES